MLSAKAFQIKQSQMRYQRRLFKLGQCRGMRNFPLESRLTRYFSGGLFLILGCQRSGTTLLYLMLSASPHISGLAEDESGHQLPSWPLMAWNRVRRQKTLFHLPDRTARLDQILERHEGVGILWMTRHPFAVISSMLSLRMRSGKTWIEQCGPSEWNLLSKVFPELHKRQEAQSDQVRFAALIWKYKNRMLPHYRKKGIAVHPVRYEELLCAPRKQLLQVVEFMETPWSEAMLHHEFFHHRRYNGGTLGDRPLDSSRLGKPSLLSAEQKEMVTGLAGEEMELLGYRSDSSESCLREAVMTCRERCGIR